MSKDVPFNVIKRGQAEEYIKLLEKLEELNKTRRMMFKQYESLEKEIKTQMSNQRYYGYTFNFEDFKKMNMWRETLKLEAMTKEMVSIAAEIQSFIPKYIETLAKIKEIDYDSGRIYT